MDNQGIAAEGIIFWRRKLPQILMLFAILTASLIPLTSKEAPICSTLTCLQEANRITYQVSFEINPCENFYEYVCGNSQRNVDPVTSLKKQAREQITNLYIEPFMPGEYPIVTTTKKLFRACLNETSMGISKFNIKEIKKALKMAGGWPLIEGSNWNETKFDWLQATYKFRELGYDYAIFLNLSITEDPRNGNKYVFEVALPTFNAFTAIRMPIMMEIAILLGANETYVLTEIEETYRYMLKLFYGARNNNHALLSSVRTYQNLSGSAINWLKFINKIIAPAAQISHKNLVLFPQAEKLTTWLHSLSKIPKRIQANYLMWKAIEQIVSNLQFEAQYDSQIEIGKSSINGCFEKMQNLFWNFPNPIDVLYIKKYLPKNKLEMVEDLVNNLKVAFLDLLGKSNWLDVKDKNNMIKIMNNITNNMIIGAPKIYFQDNILEEMSVDLEEADNDDYLKILLQLHKHYHSLIYKQVYSPINETKLMSWNLFKSTEASLHYYMENEIALPATLLEGTFFNENRPNYLNYGGLGSYLAAEYAYHFSKVILSEEATWSNKTQKGFLKIRRCFLQQVMDYLKMNGIMSEWDFELFYQTLSTHISYSAYQLWEKSNGIEPKLASSTYSNYQLFWISAASFYCQNLYSLPKIFNILKHYAFYVDGIGFNNYYFAKDFECPLESKMNPLEKCYVF